MNTIFNQPNILDQRNGNGGDFLKLVKIFGE